MRDSRSLPPLPALRAFEAVGRLLSFRRAGEELLITQSAVSHHIRNLETHLGVRLFERTPKGVSLTPAGTRYLDATARAFGVIAEETAALRADAAPPRVRASVLPSFAANWLVSRLPDFHARHPEIALDLQPTLDLADLPARAADLGVRYGSGHWPGVDARLLMADRLTPVASPALLRDGPPIREFADLVSHTLLLAKRPTDWEVWSADAGFDMSAARTVQLTDYNIIIQAAIDGRGIAIGRLSLLREHLRAGRLVTVFDRIVRSPTMGHWLVTARDRPLSAPAGAFADWLTDAMAADANAPGG